MSPTNPSANDSIFSLLLLWATADQHARQRLFFFSSSNFIFLLLFLVLSLLPSHELLSSSIKQFSSTKSIDHLLATSALAAADQPRRCLCPEILRQAQIVDNLFIFAARVPSCLLWPVGLSAFSLSPWRCSRGDGLFSPVIGLPSEVFFDRLPRSVHSDRETDGERATDRPTDRPDERASERERERERENCSDWEGER